MSKPSRQFQIRAAIIVGMTLMAYAPVVHCDYIWDDDYYVTENTTLRDWNGLYRIWFVPRSVPQYYPLVHSTFWIEYQTWGLNPLGYHVVNVIFHAMNAVLVWLVLTRLRVPGAFWAGLIFAVHPIHVESVAWITERKNVLSGLFYLGSALIYLRFSPPEPGALPSPQRWRAYVLSLMLMVCSLLSKSVTATLGPALVLVLWWRRRAFPWRDVICLAPFVLVGAALGLHTAYLEKQHVGATGDAWDFSFLERCIIAGRALWFYAWKVVWPDELIFFYARWNIDGSQLTQFIYPISAASLLLALLLLRKRITGGPITAALFFAGTLFPALGFLNVFPFLYSFVADHFQYLASLGVITLAAAGAALLFTRPDGTPYRMGLIAGVAVIAALTVRTWKQIPVYQNEESLWRHVIALNPRPWMAYNNLGNLLLDQGEPTEALRHLRLSIFLRPDRDVGYYNVGTSLMDVGLYESSLPYFEHAIALKPNYGRAIYNHGVALMKLQRLDQALAMFRRSAALMPGHGESFHNMGVTLLDLNRYDEALAALQRAHALRPTDADTLQGLGLALEQAGRFPDAILAYADAIRINPNAAGASVKLGLLYARTGRPDMALPHLRRSVQQNPTDGTSRANLAVTLLQTGQTREAIGHFREALALDPSMANTARSLAWTLATHPDAGVREPEEALRWARHAVSLHTTPNALTLDTLAAALAATERFEEAAALARDAIIQAELTGNAPLAEQIRQRLARYEAGQAFLAER